ncbi:MAG: transcription antitermination factor NusB [Aquificae bacterium]|nr:transcription antitermination factor NusB [Aquificota bacterium]
MKTYRKKARELAFLTLYQWDIRGEDLWNIFKDMIEERKVKSERVVNYAEEILKTTYENLAEIDSRIEEKLKGWSFDRIGYVERTALRMGTAELLYMNPSDPGRVFIDVLDLVKKYADEKAARFVNGVLSAVYRSFKEPTSSESKREDSGEG